MVVEEIREDHFGITQTTNEIVLSEGTTSVSGMNAAKIIISDKSSKELYWEKFETLLKK